MRLNLFASVALLCSSVLASPTQLRRQDDGLESLIGALGGTESLVLNGTESLIGGLGATISSIVMAS
jgi:hypothetical protein